MRSTQNNMEVIVRIRQETIQHWEMIFERIEKKVSTLAEQVSKFCQIHLAGFQKQTGMVLLI